MGMAPRSPPEVNIFRPPVCAPSAGGKYFYLFVVLPLVALSDSCGLYAFDGRQPSATRSGAQSYGSVSPGLIVLSSQQSRNFPLNAKALSEKPEKPSEDKTAAKSAAKTGNDIHIFAVGLYLHFI
eukprot:2974809-Amphidinium_carterae.1